MTIFCPVKCVFSVVREKFREELRTGSNLGSISCADGRVVMVEKLDPDLSFPLECLTHRSIFFTMPMYAVLRTKASATSRPFLENFCYWKEASSPVRPGSAPFGERSLTRAGEDKDQNHHRGRIVTRGSERVKAVSNGLPEHGLEVGMCL